MSISITEAEILLLILQKKTTRKFKNQKILLFKYFVVANMKEVI